MKILAIRIKNLASLEGETVIDFTNGPLCTAGIFAITGPTGAGKSTILDALCLALYAETPRYNKASDPTQAIEDVGGNLITQSDPRGMLRDGAGEGFAEVDFIGADGLRYRSQWSVRRARFKAEGALQGYQINLKNLEDNSDEQGTKTEILASIVRKIGLTFDQFTRAVLLAQGDFTAFLKAGNNDKADLLEKLTGTHIYSEISKRIFEHHRQEKEELAVMQVKIDGIAVLNEEQRTTFLARRAELEILLNTERNNVDILKKELGWFEHLSVLQKGLNDANDALKNATEQKDNTVQREIALKQIELVQPIRSTVEVHKLNSDQLTIKSNEIDSLTSQIELLKSQTEEHGAILVKAKANLDTCLKHQQEAQPLLNEAKALDIKIAEREKQVNEAKGDWERAHGLFEKHKEELDKREKEARELNKILKAAELFKENHIERRLVAENHQVIITKLSQAQKVVTNHQEIGDRVKAVREQIKNKKEEEINQGKRLTRLRGTMDKLVPVLKELRNTLAAAGIATLRRDCKASDLKVEELAQALADWKTLAKAIQQRDKWKDDLKLNTKELSSLQKKLDSGDKEVETTLIRKEAASRALDIAKMAASKDVNKLREQLIEDEPCPVCGSEEHPYATSNPRLNHVLLKLREEFQSASKKYDEANRHAITLKTQIGQLEKEIKKVNYEIVLQEREIKEYGKEWNRFSLRSEAEKQDVDDVETWIKQLLAKEKATQKKLQKQIEDWEEQKEDLDKHQKSYDDIFKQVNSADNTLKDIQRLIKSSEEQLSRDEANFNKAGKDLEEIRESLTNYFTNQSWFENWNANPESFVDNLNQFASEWQKQTDILEKTGKELIALDATISGLRKRSEQLNLENINKQTVLSGLRENHTLLGQERKMIFEGASVNEVESKLKIEIETANEIHANAQKAVERIQAESIAKDAQKTEITREIDRLKTETGNLLNKVNQWLLDHNLKYSAGLTLEELERMLAVPQEWMENERIDIHKINSDYLQAQTIVNERSSVLKEHMKDHQSEKTIEEIKDSLKDVQKNLEDLTREDTEAEFRLNQDADNRNKAGLLLKEIEVKGKLVENWGRLNQVIGSADGKKFRQVAQEYTLEVLLGYANIQLKMLSNRYVLERIRNSLALQVIDQDMGNDKRSVNSLSGGESFLVSLALALGLASLSSSRMRVESLFIDEGFGSLDPNTLNVAMDALERLHNQGRKVGVISHVQEMTERIPVKIQVSKQNGGRSAVEVISV